jgi:hypothetical protein
MRARVEPLIVMIALAPFGADPERVIHADHWRSYGPGRLDVAAGWSYDPGVRRQDPVQTSAYDHA